MKKAHEAADRFVFRRVLAQVQREAAPEWADKMLVHLIEVQLAEMVALIPQTSGVAVRIEVESWNPEVVEEAK